MRRLLRSRALVAAGVAVVVLGGGVAAYATGTEATGRYRTVAAAVGDVEQTLALSGTLASAGRSDLAFGSAGEVARVAVATGDQVAAGDVLAVLDRTALRSTLERARADLAAAQAQLAADEEAQADAVTAAEQATASTGTRGTSEPTSGHKGKSGQAASGQKKSEPKAPATDPELAAALAKLQEQQRAVTGARSAAGEAIDEAKAALAAQTEACEAAFSEPDSTAADPAPDPDAPTDGTGDETDPDAAATACTESLEAVQAAQDRVAVAQEALQKALTALGETLTGAVKALRSAQPTAQPTAQPSAQPSAEPATRQQAPTQRVAGARSVTAATLADDQARIDEAQASVVEAEQALAGATLRAPYAGTVASVGVAPGDAASAGADVVVLVAPGTTTVDVAVSATQLARLEVGQAASVTPAGASEPLPATISRLGTLPSSGTTGNTTYPVTLTLDGTGLGLPDGMTATVEVTVGTADDVLTVPTSAVSSGSVQVLTAAGPERRRVTTGVVGSRLTEIADGVSEGDAVILADLDQAVPSADSTTQGGPGGLGGTSGFGGAGMPGGVVRAPRG